MAATTSRELTVARLGVRITSLLTVVVKIRNLQTASQPSCGTRAQIPRTFP
jgi:hypothetical protein